MSINYPIWVINRLPQYWDRPNEFWPERWLDVKTADGDAGGLRPVPKNNTLPFIPFNFGPRTCLGMKMVPPHHAVPLDPRCERERERGVSV
jgi:2-hydroxyisoflavanone synthase